MKRSTASIASAIATVTLLWVPAAEARSKYADIRVVTNDGVQLADHRQYTEDVKVQASQNADCFGESNPSSNETYKLEDATVLGALIDASKVDADLDPVLVTDAFFGAFGSFGVCGIGDYVAPPFAPGDPAEPYWYYATNGEAAQSGPNGIPVEDGDRHLWYFATGEEKGFPSELVLQAPVRVLPGEKFPVKVIRVRKDGSRTPAGGVTVTGGLRPTNDDGKTRVTVEAGNTDLVAEGRAKNVDSALVRVCAAADLSDCPKARGRTIFGSPGGDVIAATRGPDEISCGRGVDVVRSAQNQDEIAPNCEKVRR